jgi:5-methyltetrahydrofolate--homocysteine methyltransferase
MCNVAAELEREGMDLPLLIGGATTSRVHTAVKIAPNYNRGQAVYVNDASRAVGVVSALLNPEQKKKYIADTRSEYEKVADAHSRAEDNKVRTPIAQARENGLKLDFKNYTPPKPTFLGTRVFKNYDLLELSKTIDWTPFFPSWELKGSFPRILEDEKYGAAARGLYEDAQKMLDRMIREGWIEARAVIGFWPANAEGDDIVLFKDKDDTRKERIATLHTLRQQMARKDSSRVNLALSDFIAPLSTKVRDYIGAFVVTAGIGEEAKSKELKGANNDYDAILMKALSDRFAESFAERMHQRVRTEYWGYAPDEKLTNNELIEEKYQGIRPAPGYPAQPDHTEKGTIFRLLDAERAIDVKITESFAMWPGASVSGVYFSHPESAYFGVGRIDRDQVEDYAKRKGWTVAEAEKWLAPSLSYNPARLPREAA